MANLMEWDTQAQRQAEKQYQLFLIDSAQIEDEAQRRYILIRCAQRLLEGVDVSLAGDAMRTFANRS